jgi:ribulose-5-phosphate 4-epimerase/fuculose-1-phosphate aldolase
MADDLRAEVVLGGRVLEHAGLSDMVWGHVSARDPDGRGVWMKASGQGFDEVTEATVLLVDPAGEVLAGEGARHSEYPIHTEILRARPDAGSVVHVHPFHAMAFAASDVELRAFSHIGGVFSGGVRRYHDAAGLVATAEEGAALAAALGEDRALLLVGHGIVTVGASVGVAVTTAIMLERACRLQLLAECYGGVARPFDAAQARRAYAHTLSDDYLRSAWEYMVRRL